MITEEVSTNNIVATESHKTTGANFVTITQATAMPINNKLIINVTINVFLEIELEGAMNIMKLYPDAVSIFILPPSLEELERRLRDRGTESERDILNRLQRAEVEIENAVKYKYTVINDKVEKAVEDVLSIVREETQR